MDTTEADTPNRDAEENLWPMGAVTRRTGISEHTLRAWERRFDFPKPVRLASGHRRYTNDQVRQLLLINRALGCGYRAGDVVPLPVGRIQALVRECIDNTSGSDPQVVSRRWVEGILHDTLAFDETSIRMRLFSDAATLGVGRYLRERAAPLIEELGEAWARDEIGVRHEHFVSGILEDNLRAMRLPFEASAVGRPVVLACLPDELHALGLQLVALEIAAAGRKTLVLGSQTPVDEIVNTATSQKAAAVGLSVSAFAPSGVASEQIAALRAALPKRTSMWVGGSGAESLKKLPKDIRQLSTLDDVVEAVRSLVD